MTATNLDLISAAQKRWDVVVVGAGNAALCAALSARELGADVVMIEAAKPDQRGGNSRFTDGAIRLAHGGLPDLRSLIPELSDEEAARIDLAPYPIEAFVNDMMRLSGGRTKENLAVRLAEQSTDTVRWMLSQGVEFELIFDNQAVREEGRYRFWGGLVLRSVGRGVGLTDRLFARAKHLDIPMVYGNAAVGLLREFGTITGVIVGPSQIRFDCGAVVLACGGFEASPELRSMHLGSKWKNVIVRGTPYNTGGGLTMALEAGAVQSGDWTGCHSVAMDQEAPEFGDFEIGGDIFKKHSYPYGIVVNQNGQRFVDEGADFRNYTYARYGRALLEQPGGIAYQIFDQQVESLLRSEYFGKSSTGYESPSLQGLANQLDIDQKAFLRTVTHYNQAVQNKAYVPHALDGKGTKGLSPPKSNWALRIEQPPFRAFPVRCGITFTYGGVDVSEDGEVLDDSGTPIPGLFAAGEMVGGLFFNGYPGGSGLASGAVFGRISGLHAANKASQTRNA